MNLTRKEQSMTCAIEAVTDWNRFLLRHSIKYILIRLGS